jgi:hypothetical protein
LVTLLIGDRAFLVRRFIREELPAEVNLVSFMYDRDTHADILELTKSD